MANLLHIDSSPLGEASVSRALSREFVQNWKTANPGGKIVTRDLNAENLPSMTASWLAANFTPESARTNEQKELLSISEALIAELLAADVLVLGVPMHNFGIPAVLKLWIDQIGRAGKTFSITKNGPVGLVTGKKAHVFVASGGVYDLGSPDSRLEFCGALLAGRIGIHRHYGHTVPVGRWHRRPHARPDRPGYFTRASSHRHPRTIPLIFFRNYSSDFGRLSDKLDYVGKRYMWLARLYCGPVTHSPISRLINDCFSSGRRLDLQCLLGPIFHREFSKQSLLNPQKCRSRQTLPAVCRKRSIRTTTPGRW